MKVLLLEDIKGLGKKGEIREVKDGYGQNFLIAKNKAKHATNEVINKYRSQQKHQAELEALELEKRKQLAKSLESITLVLEKKGNNGTLFRLYHQRGNRHHLAGEAQSPHRQKRGRYTNTH